MLSQKCATNLSDQLSFGQQWVPSEADWNRQCPPQSSSWSLLTEGIPAGPFPHPLQPPTPTQNEHRKGKQKKKMKIKKIKYSSVAQCLVSCSIA